MFCDGAQVGMKLNDTEILEIVLIILNRAMGIFHSDFDGLVQD